MEVFSPSLPSARIVDISDRRVSVDTVSVMSYKSAESDVGDEDEAELTTGTTNSSPNCDSENFSTFGRKRGGDLRNQFLAMEREREHEAAVDVDEDSDVEPVSDVEVGIFDTSNESVQAVSTSVLDDAVSQVKERVVVGVAF